MSFIWILVAFIFGYGAKQLSLPPLVGYLLAGFILHSFGVEPEASLQTLADLGISLMLFTIGLKVNFKQLLRVDIWSATLGHMTVWVIFLFPILSLLATLVSLEYLNLTLVQSALVGFALSFSSTVCAIKVLEDNSELKTKHGDLTIGILIVQDIVAVAFLIAATGKVPSIWAFGLFALLFIRPFLKWLSNTSGHGELLPLLGFLFALGGVQLFELVNLKGDLGALMIGMLIAGLPKANEMYKSLMSFKDLFLISFFLLIGFTALPTFDMWMIAVVLSLILPNKLMLFFIILTSLARRARTGLLTSLLLANYSEFGLIVASLSVTQGWLSEQWLVIIALSVSLSFVFSTLIYKSAHVIYGRNKAWLLKFQQKHGDLLVPYKSSPNAKVLIIGMGRVGAGAYEELTKHYPNQVWGLDVEQERADSYKAKGLNVTWGDADDIEFWESINLSKISLIMLAIPSVVEMKNIIIQLNNINYSGRIAVIARYEDERLELIKLGADVAFDYYAEVGIGFAEESIHLLK
ncbi:MAG: glutathione-regulated potassium-efflux system ancillary protein KefC [Oleiphilaceae bacterium]|jgi:glutathione-regulated potassium-efflux system ancillary protein KefC